MYKFLVVTLLFFSVLSSNSQKYGEDQSFYFDFGQRFFTEAIVFPAETDDSLFIDVLYRTAHSILTFNENSKTSDNSKKFVAYPRVNIDFRDTDGVIRKRVQKIDTVYVSSFEETKEKTKYVFGNFSVKLPSDSYKVNVELENHELNVLEKTEINELGKPQSGKKKIFSPLICYQDQDQSDEIFYPFVLDGRSSFNSKTVKLIYLLNYDKNYSSFEYNLKLDSENESGFKWVDSVNFSGQVEAESNIEIKLSPLSSQSSVAYQSINDVASLMQNTQDNAYGYLIINLPTRYLVPGDYSIEISQVGTDLSEEFEFEVFWLDKPLSLSKPDYAAEVMYYILSDEQFDRFTDGSNFDISERVINYWKRQDPTKNTPFNEAMAEYYYRVDYAFFNYQAIGERDGAKTERGKVFILKGNPTEITRELGDGKNIEKWFYENLNQEFIFETNASNRYILTKINDLE